MLTCNKLMTNVLYSEAVKGSLYATPNTAHRRPFSTCSPHKLSNGVSWSRIGCSSGEKLEHGWFWYQASKKIHFSSPPRNGQHTQSPLRACLPTILKNFSQVLMKHLGGGLAPTWHHAIACFLWKSSQLYACRKMRYHFYFSLCSRSPRLPRGIPTKIAIIEKTESARGTVERRKRLPSSSRPPSRRARSAFFFFLPSLLRQKRELKQRRFWATDVNRKWSIFPLNMPWRYKICIP